MKLKHLPFSFDVERGVETLFEAAVHNITASRFKSMALQRSHDAMKPNFCISFTVSFSSFFS